MLRRMARGAALLAVACAVPLAIYLGADERAAHERGVVASPPARVEIEQLAPPDTEAMREAARQESVELALAIDEEGRLASAQVARSSGQTRFDDGVLATLRDAAPYPKPPASVRNSHGRVLLLWSFQHSESGCGIWSAQAIGEGPQAQ